MKKLLLIALLFCFTKTKAQYVTIPDANFLSYLQSVIPTALNGNQMDTNSTAVTTLTYITVGSYSITNLTGVQYFDALTTLDCSSNQINNLPKLPNTLQFFQCSFNPLTSLPSLPNSLRQLVCVSNGLTSLPPLPNSLRQLICPNNSLTSLPALPNLLQNLTCSTNQLTSLPTLPDSLRTLSCGYNQLTSLPMLPDSLLNLYCSHNQLTSLPALPGSLQNLNCCYNQLTNLPALPNLAELVCNNNNITCFPPFPNSLAYQSSSCPTCSPSPLNFSNNPFNCIPNYVSVMDSIQHSYPLCSAGNSNGCAVAGITTFNTQNSTLHIYPNPANNKITIDAADVVDVKLFDVLGKQISSAKENQIDVSSLNDGVYFMQVQTKQNTSTQKIIVQH
jgi:Leucine-rich repeat (LRR) protein